MIIDLKCGNDRILMVDQSKFLISGAVNIDTVTCEFGDTWQGTIIAVFSRDGAVYHVEQRDGRFAVPREVIASNGILKIGMFAVDGEHVMTSTVLLFAIAEGALTHATAIADPTPDIYQQIISSIGDLTELTTASKDNLVHAINEAAQTGSGSGLTEDDALESLDECDILHPAAADDVTIFTDDMEFVLTI